MEIFNKNGKEIEGKVVEGAIEFKEENIELEDRNEEAKSTEILDENNGEVGLLEMNRKKIRLEDGDGSSWYRSQSRRELRSTPLKRRIQMSQRRVEASRSDPDYDWIRRKHQTLIEMEIDHMRQKRLLQLEFLEEKRELELALEEEMARRDMLFKKWLIAQIEEVAGKESIVTQELMEKQLELAEINNLIQTNENGEIGQVTN